MQDTRQQHLEALGLTLWQSRSINHGRQSRDSAAPYAAADSAGPVFEANASISAPVSRDVARLDWEMLFDQLAAQDYRGASRPVFGIGARDADLMIVGEAPGADEDRLGEPFVGRGGQLLDQMLAAIGRDRTSNTYIANICKFRPPNNRDPNADEIATDRPFLEQQIDLLAPKLIVATGRVAAQTLLQRDEALGKMRGQVHTYPGRELPVLVTYHPAYLLRSPQHKARAWLDLKRVYTWLPSP